MNADAGGNPADRVEPASFDLAAPDSIAPEAAAPADAGPPPADASGPPADASGPPADASGPPLDAGAPPIDAAAPPPDRAAPAPDAPLPVGTGLRGDYYDGVALELGDTGVLEHRRVDAVIDFDWGVARPVPDMDDDWFSVRWTGQVMPLHSETYTFSTSTDDGVRLWIDGVLVIDRWVKQAASVTNTGTIPLTAYRRYAIKMEYYEETEQAVARLYWASPSQRREIVPRACLFPPP